jgi:hypothetical protein
VVASATCRLRRFAHPPGDRCHALAIRALIREAQLNPRDSDWRRFLVADEAGTSSPARRSRARRWHRASSRSVAVRKDRRGGVGRAISEARSRASRSACSISMEARNEFERRLRERRDPFIARRCMARLFASRSSILQADCGWCVMRRTT